MTVTSSAKSSCRADLSGIKPPIPTTLIRRDSAIIEDEIANGELVENLRRAIVDELCVLRCDIDDLKRGGWKVAIGPFQQAGDLQTPDDREQIRQEIVERVESKVSGGAVELKEAKKTPISVDVPPTKNTITNAKNSIGSGTSDPWRPAFIRSLKTLAVDFPSKAAMVTFTWDFLMTIFNGAMEHSPGLYYIPKHAGGSLIPGRAFYAISAEHEPFLPSKPSAHGAKMTAFFNPDPPADDGETAYKDVPLFVSTTSGKYVYFGTYSQSRWSDRVSHDILSTYVPTSVKAFWASQLADPTRPAWVTRCLMKQFFPMPEYEGPMPAGSESTAATEDMEEKHTRRLKKAVENYVEELRLWEKEARTKVGLMKKEDILKAFDQADTDENPGLRLWWEYLECKQWDKAFYDMLVKKQTEISHRR